MEWNTCGIIREKKKQMWDRVLPSLLLENWSFFISFGLSEIGRLGLFLKKIIIIGRFRILSTCLNMSHIHYLRISSYSIIHFTILTLNFELLKKILYFWPKSSFMSLKSISVFFFLSPWRCFLMIFEANYLIGVKNLDIAHSKKITWWAVKCEVFVQRNILKFV